MAKLTLDEEQLKELIQEAIQKHLKESLDDMEEVRRSPAAAIVRLEARLDSIEKNMATRADLAQLRLELTERTTAIEVELDKRISAVEKGLGERISAVEKGLGERISAVEKGLGERINGLATDLGERISKLETGQKIMFGVFLSMLSATLAMLVKLVFFP